MQSQQHSHQDSERAAGRDDGEVLSSWVAEEGDEVLPFDKLCAFGPHEAGRALFSHAMTGGHSDNLALAALNAEAKARQRTLPSRAGAAAPTVSFRLASLGSDGALMPLANGSDNQNATLLMNRLKPASSTGVTAAGAAP